MTRTTLGLIAVFALIAAACVAFGAYFSYVTLLNAHRSIIEARFGIAATRVAEVAEMADSLGIRLPAQATLVTMLEREARSEPAITSIDLVDERGSVLFSSSPGRAGTSEGALRRGLSRPIRNDLGATIGQVVVRYDPQILAAGAQVLGADLTRIALPTLVAAGVATVLVGLLLAAGLRRAVRRAAQPDSWPPAAKAALVSATAAHRGAARLAAGGPESERGHA
ncbi:hypothetical protein ACI7BZ_00400 [Xanthobacter sp. AM11]|uniref:hypothetical protein n=1 Tax=Xanthobacter sp. AM11 TaxID=3380643 RepID=UPI0039BF2547